MTDQTEYEDRRFWAIEPYETMKRNGEIRDYWVNGNTVNILMSIPFEKIEVAIGFYDPSKSPSGTNGETKYIDLSNLNDNFPDE